MSRGRTLLIANPIRSTKAAKLLTSVQDTLEQMGVPSDLKPTEREGHGMELASQGVAQGYETIVAVGGDGTVNEVVNGVVGSEVAIFSIPLGAGNDFLRSLGIWTWREACQVLAEGEVTHIDLGLAEYQDDAARLARRYYAVLADVGFGSEVVRNTPRRFRHALGGNLGYLVSIYRTAIQGRAHARQMRVTVNGEMRYDEKLLLVEAYNGTYGGGGIKVALKAKLDDGLLDVFLVREMSWLKIWVLFPKILRGTHIDHESAEYLHVRDVKVEADSSISVSVDGELIGHAPVRFSIVPGALKIISPWGTG
jgi:diacylglycerol kinase (ATP)